MKIGKFITTSELEPRLLIMIAAKSRPTRPLILLFSLLPFTALACACGGGEAVPAKSPSPSAEESAVAEAEPANLEEARAQFERAKAQLESGQGAAAPQSPSPAGAVPPAPPSPTAPAPSFKSESAPSPCATSCRALASMLRATDAICRLAGNGDARCADAHRTLDANTQRLAGCRCAQ